MLLIFKDSLIQVKSSARPRFLSVRRGNSPTRWAFVRIQGQLETVSRVMRAHFLAVGALFEVRTWGPRVPGASGPIIVV